MPRKGENIYKRKDGRWEGRYIKERTLNGKAKYGYVYAKTYREVKTKMIEKAGSKDKNLSEVSQDRPDLFEDIANMWLESVRQQAKESTNNRYTNLLNLYIIPKFCNLPINRITHEFIENYCNDLLHTGGMKGTGLSPKTVADILSVIRNILNFAKRNGKNVMCDASAIRIKHSVKEMRVLSRTEQKILCKHLYSDLTTYNIGILICLFTGLRLGEICALQWEDISFKDQTIHVSKTMQRIQDASDSKRKTKVIVTSPKSTCSIRTIPVPDELLQIICSCQITTKGYFLTNSNQKIIEPRTMQNHFKRVLKNCCIEDANFHSLRHTFATRCIEFGFDVKTLSEILGHASVNITMNRYVHPSLELKKENMERLSFLLDVK